tara:strand:+ start:506 stop:1045 length:540 start_codon:yes stop_codon:yes gene_type:complete
VVHVGKHVTLLKEKQVSAVRGTGQQKPHLTLYRDKKMAYLEYEKLIQKGLLTTVELILEDVQKKGLKDPHHFYITFATTHPGVIIPAYLREEYPEEMTIVLQYQFWDLKVYDHLFSVSLSFNDQDETLTIPYSSLINFSDPSENFSLEFSPELTLPKNESPDAEAEQEKIISLDRFRKK